MYVDGKRMMAWVAQIDDVIDIPNADFICIYKILGWQVVDQKNKYNVGDLVIYISIDSWIPHSIAPFLTQDGHYPKVYNEVEGQRLKTKKLRGVYSQGLLLSLNGESFPKNLVFREFEEGEDLTEFLGIQKWDRPLPTELRGVAKGNFPSFIPKTDQERVQNLTKQLPNYVGQCFEVTEKLHGSSMTVYIKDGVHGVCSRNIDLKETDTNTYWKVAKEFDLLGILTQIYFRENIEYALQGEMIGEGINGNMYNIKGHQFRLFDIYNITEGRYLKPIERLIMWTEVCREGNMHVPIMNSIFDFTEFHTVEQLLKMVEHKSTITPKVWAEGWVLKANDGSISFKVVSNKFLMSGGEDS